MMRKLRQQKGETLVETLISMLIIVLAIALLSTCIMSAARINNQTKEADIKYRKELLAAESRTGTSTPATVKVEFESSAGQDVNVNLYGNADSDFISYDYVR